MVKIETERFFVIGLQHLILVELLPCENLPPIKLNLINLNRIKVKMGMNKATIFKIVELIIVCVLIGLHYHSFSDSSLNSAFITMGTFGGYLIILVGMCLGIILGATIDRRLDLFFSIVGCILFVIVGALILDHFINAVYRGNFRNTGIAKGSISIVQGILFMVDAVFAFRGN